ncbi:MAG: putative colanic acid biosynthesis acetyltransferase, partial [Opitutae bacterium]
MKQVHPNQHSQYASPWSISVRVKMLLWEACWTLLCSWTPKPMNPWRLFILRLFGARIKGNPFVHQRARIKIPWNLTLQNRACLGDRANAYSLG